ncbi:MAG: PP2C family serine/threonine-protein phosphatase [Oligoflexales bacterium]
MPIRMEGATDVGRLRSANQDSIYYHESFGIGIVADGVGGRKGGEVASSMAVNIIRQAYLECDRIGYDEVPSFLREVIQRANREILERGLLDENIQGMGTTVNCLIFLGDHIHIGHVGDSRTYLYHEQNMWQLTVDHNVQTMLQRGKIQKQQINAQSSGGALVRALGLTDYCEVDLYEKILTPGEIYITASDGLFDMVPDKDITRIITEYKHNLKELPLKLIEEANRRGGKDNITVLVSQVEP